MEQPRHVVFFTHNEQSHITPMFSMARDLARRGLHVTCALPATSYASYCTNNTIKNSASDTAIQVVPVAEAVEHTSNDLFLLQQKLEEGLEQLMRRLQPPPLFLIGDMMYFKWLQTAADRLGVALFLFCPFLATSMLVACHLPELLGKGFLPFQPGMQAEIIDFIPGLMKGFCVADVPVDFLGRSAVELEAFNMLRHCKACAGVVFCNSSYALETEAEALDALVALGICVYPLAPTLHMDWCNNSTLLFREDDKCTSWLDRQPSGSVVYASFGGIIHLTKEEIEELAFGLEACGQPFLWVIRPIEGTSHIMSVLPSGFLDRITGRGCIVAWAPQMAVLSHPSVGCFITHCGCGSLVEAIWTGVPMIGGFYKISDQNTVFKVMTDGLRVALPLNTLSCQPHSALRSSIEVAIQEVLHGQHVGATIKQRIVQLNGDLREAVLAPSGVSRCYFDRFVDSLLSSACHQGSVA